MMLDPKPPKEEIKDESESESPGIRAISSEPEPGCSNTPDHVVARSKVRTWLGSSLPENVSVSQQNDPDIGFLLNAVKDQAKPKSVDLVAKSHAARYYVSIWDNLVVKDNVLYKLSKKTDSNEETLQLIVPMSLRETIMFQMHNSLTAGHMGTKKTKAKISRYYHWHQMREDINLYVKGCEICGADKKPSKNPRAPMGSLRAGGPWDTLAIDFTGPFPLTPRGNRFILIMSDHFTKYVEVFAVPDQTAETCASRILNDFVSHWGCPLSIHSDQGAAFESKLFKDLCQMLDIRKSRTSARNPRANGQIERYNRTMLKMVRAYLAGEQANWDLNLGCLAGAYRCTPNEATGMSPNLLCFGREIRLPADLMFHHPQAVSNTPTSESEYVQALRNRMLHAHDLAREHLSASGKISKDLYDAKLSFHHYEVGDIVWCLHETRKPGVCPKLEKAYDGPYVVKQKLSSVNFILQLDNEGATRTVHHNKLKIYEGNNPPKWVTRAANLVKRKI